VLEEVSGWKNPVEVAISQLLPAVRLGGELRCPVRDRFVLAAADSLSIRCLRSSHGQKKPTSSIGESLSSPLPLLDLYIFLDYLQTYHRWVALVELEHVVWKSLTLLGFGL
jgi:hypothetical protein